MDSIKTILKTIDDAINSFQDTIPGLQKQMFDELQVVVKQLELKNGRLLNNVNNLKLLGTLKNKLQRIIVSKDYKDAVQKFIDSYDAVSARNMTYFRKFNQKYSPAKTLPLIKQLAVESTVNDLLGQGLNVNVIDAVNNILNTNITSGGSYASLQDQLRNHILTNDSGDGSLVKYTRQITTDAINQFHAQYHETIGQDLQFNWGRYVGSLLTTSRQFCVLLTKKEWVHKSELPEIIKGNIDGAKCKLSKSTGLPLGMIAGTDENNFKIRRGGYQCGHHYFEVPDSAVPENIKNKSEEISHPFVDINKLKDFAGENINLKMLDQLTGPVGISITNSGGSYYNPNTDVIVFDELFGGDSTIHKELVTYHEFGHAIHDHKEIITPTNVNDDFKKVYNASKKGLKSGFDLTMEDLRSILQGVHGYDKDFKLDTELKKYDLKNAADLKESISVVYDIIGSLTNGLYGGGHSVSYYKRNNGAYAELFAHGNYLYNLENKFVEEKLPDVVEILRKYFTSLYEK